MSQLRSQAVVYTPTSRLRTPGRLLRDMVHSLKEGAELSWRLFVRDVSAQYRQSALGMLWAFVPPLATGIVFIILQTSGVLRVSQTEIPYPVYVFSGTMLWQLFVQSLNAPLKSVTAAKPMLAKINFSYEALIVSAFYMVLFHMAVNTLVLTAIFVLFRVPPTIGLLAAPFAVLLLIVLGIGLGLLLTPLGLLYTDIQAALPIIVQLWFFVTPVVYPMPTTGPLAFLAFVNPVSPLLTTARALLVGATVSSPIWFGLVGTATLALLFVAWIVYRASLPILIERMGS